MGFLLKKRIPHNLSTHHICWRRRRCELHEETPSPKCQCLRKDLPRHSWIPQKGLSPHSPWALWGNVELRAQGCCCLRLNTLHTIPSVITSRLPSDTGGAQAATSAGREGLDPSAARATNQRPCFVSFKAIVWRCETHAWLWAYRYTSFK